MFASKNPLLFFFLVFAIVAAVTATIVVTKNPLALLGLFFVPQVPVVQPPAGEFDMDESELDGRGMGFTADI